MIEERKDRTPRTCVFRTTPELPTGNYYVTAPAYRIAEVILEQEKLFLEISRVPRIINNH